MSSLGNDAATATLRLGEKGIEAIFKLLKFMAEKDERELKKLQVGSLKNELEKKKATEFLNQHRGFVNYKKLVKSGEKLYVSGISISPKNMKKFQEYAKLHGLTYSSIEDKRVSNQIKNFKLELEGLEKIRKNPGLTEEQQERISFLNSELEKLEHERQDKLIIIRENDLDVLKDVCDRLNLDINLENNEKDIVKNSYHDTEYVNDDIENVSIDVEVANEANIKDYFSRLNERSLDFNRGVTSVTGMGSLDKPIFIVDLNDEENYIKVFSEQGVKENGEEFVITNYDVCTHGVHPVCETWEHGKFQHWSNGEGGNKSEKGITKWQQMKGEMRTKGSFSQDVYIFQSEKSFEQFRQAMKKVKSNELTKETSFVKEDINMEFIDCPKIIRELDIVRNVSSLNEKEMEILNKRVKTYQEIHDLQNNVYMMKSEKISSIENLRLDGADKEVIEKKEAEFDTKISKLEEKLVKKKEQAEKLGTKFQKTRAKSIADGTNKTEKEDIKSKGKSREDWEKATDLKKEQREKLPHREDIVNVKNVVNKDNIELGR